ncbi:E3 ubiquitin-protein ligase TRIM62 [Alosa pseudoharengus]|uniref:E3 ubiquitin-protein ligase TRIM62 n=1 Tax=Alosa pseudoharengus TaxID=34774 RepID=UPI003F89793E
MESASVSCPICGDAFSDPVALPCGHSFCHACIRTVWSVDDGDGPATGTGPSQAPPPGPLFCPECQILLPPDVQLQAKPTLLAPEQEASGQNQGGQNQGDPDWNGASVPADLRHEVTALSGVGPALTCDHCIERVSAAVRSCVTCDAALCAAHAEAHQRKQALRTHTLVEPAGDLLPYRCQRHGEELRLYCAHERLPVCSLCAALGDHRGHAVIPLQEAAADLKRKLEATESVLLENRLRAENAVKELEVLSSETLSSIEACRVRVLGRYSAMRALLDEDERLMTAVLDAERLYCGRWLQVRRDQLQRHLRDTDVLRDTRTALIHEDNHLKLLQHLTTPGATLDPPLVPELQADSCAPPGKMATLERLVEELHNTLSAGFPRMWSYLRGVTLDPRRAHPKLVVSADSREVRWSTLPPQGGEDDSVHSQYSVLGSEAFSSGLHYWEVIVWDKPYWLIGVSHAPATTGHQGAAVDVAPADLNQVFCYMYHGNGQYLVCHGALECPLEVEGRVRKVGVLVDCQQGALSFYNADTLELLQSVAMETGRAVIPTLNPCISFGEHNSHPLILYHLTKHTHST